MKVRSLAGASLLLLSCSITGAAQDRGSWKAANSSAEAITGDLILGGSRVTLGFIPFTIAQIRKLEPAEAAALFASEDNPGPGFLYRLNIPAAQRFFHKNTLCGSEDTQWMVTSVTGKRLHVAFFSGATPPVLTFEALNKSTDLCGTFAYAR